MYNGDCYFFVAIIYIPQVNQILGIVTLLLMHLVNITKMLFYLRKFLRYFLMVR